MTDSCGGGSVVYSGRTVRMLFTHSNCVCERCLEHDHFICDEIPVVCGFMVTYSE